MTRLTRWNELVRLLMTLMMINRKVMQHPTTVLTRDRQWTDLQGGPGGGGKLRGV